MATIYKRGRTYWIQYYRDGKPYRESAETRSKSLAEWLLNKREMELSKPNYGLLESKPLKRLLNVKETAQYLGIEPRTIYNGVAPNSTKPFPIGVRRIGKLIRFDIRDLDQYIDSLDPRKQKEDKLIALEIDKREMKKALIGLKQTTKLKREELADEKF